MTEPAYSERRSASAIDKYAFQLAALLKTEASKSRKQRRTLKQIHEDLKELGFEGSYDRVAAFARVWREGQIDRVNSASKRTVSAYVSFEDDGYWLPEVRKADKNTKISKPSLAGIAKFYEENYSRFWNTPKFPPNL